MRTDVKRLTSTLIALALLTGVLPALDAVAADGKVNVNQAAAEELALLPRIGPATAQRIVEFREQNGPFRSLEDLMLVRGIGESTFELIAPYAALDGATTLAVKVRVPRGSTADSGD